MDIRNVAAERIAANERMQRTRRGGATGGARFALPADAPHFIPPSRAAVATGALDALIALQAVEDPLERKRRTAKRGRDLLDHLDAIKLSLLGGQAPDAALQTLAGILKAREQSDDPILDGIIAEIELRAAVELAKRGLA